MAEEAQNWKLGINGGIRWEGEGKGWLYCVVQVTYTRCESYWEYISIDKIEIVIIDNLLHTRVLQANQDPIFLFTNINTLTSNFQHIHSTLLHFKNSNPHPHRRRCSPHQFIPTTSILATFSSPRPHVQTN